jgi:hypothetical protein
MATRKKRAASRDFRAPLEERAEIELPSIFARAPDIRERVWMVIFR